MENNEELKAEVVEETSTEVAQETPAATILLFWNLKNSANWESFRPL